MAILLDQKGGTFNTLANTIMIPVTTTSSNEVVVVTGIYNNGFSGPPSGLTISGAGLSWTQIDYLTGISGTSGFYFSAVMSVWYAVSPTTLSASNVTISATGGSTGGNAAMYAMYASYSGASVSYPIDANNTLPASLNQQSTTNEVTISTTGSNDVILIAATGVYPPSNPAIYVPSTLGNVVALGTSAALYQSINYATPQTNLTIGFTPCDTINGSHGLGMIVFAITGTIT